MFLVENCNASTLMPVATPSGYVIGVTDGPGESTSPQTVTFPFLTTDPGEGKLLLLHGGRGTFICDDVEGLSTTLVETHTLDELATDTPTAIALSRAAQLFHDSFRSRGRIIPPQIAIVDPNLLVIAARDEYSRKGNTDRLLHLAQMLGELGDRAVPALLRAFMENSDGEPLLLDAVNSLKMSARGRARVLQQACRHRDSEVRLAAAQLVEFYRQEDWAGELLRMLRRDPDADVRGAVSV